MRKFKSGDRVIPLRKSHSGSLEACFHWEQAKRIGQPYLYVIEYEGDKIVLNHTGKGHAGNYYAESDLVPYQNTQEEIEKAFERFVKGELTERQFRAIEGESHV